MNKDDAVKTMQSVISKLEKCAPGLAGKPSQLTLLQNRLGVFNLSLGLLNFYYDLIGRQETVTAELEKMKTEGKEKTVRYRELFGQKLMDKSTIEQIEKYVAH